MLVPLTFIEGIYLVFESSTWTLTYREVAGTAAVVPSDAEAAPAVAAG